MIALTAVIACVKLKTSVARIAGRRSGTTTSRSVRIVEPRSVADASSSVLSICASAAMPARTPTGKAVPRDDVGREETDDRGERRGDGGDLDRVEEAVPGRAGEPRRRARPI